jgi:hypothetical protein
MCKFKVDITISQTIEPLDKVYDKKKYYELETNKPLPTQHFEEASYTQHHIQHRPHITWQAHRDLTISRIATTLSDSKAQIEDPRLKGVH